MNTPSPSLHDALSTIPTCIRLSPPASARATWRPSWRSSTAAVPHAPPPPPPLGQARLELIAVKQT